MQSAALCYYFLLLFLTLLKQKNVFFTCVIARVHTKLGDVCARSDIAQRQCQPVIHRTTNDYQMTQPGTPQRCPESGQATEIHKVHNPSVLSSYYCKD